MTPSTVDRRGSVSRDGETIRLFCFPYAGAGASVYISPGRQWPDALAEIATVHPVQLPGREGRISEPPFEQLPPLIQSVCDEIESLAAAPYALFGHSLGALIAFELVRELRRRGKPEPLHLFASAHAAPRMGGRSECISHLPEETLKERLRELGGTPEEVLAHPELMELLLPVIRADFAVTESYRYEDEPPLSCPITAFAGTEDAQVAVKSVDAWRNETTGPFAIHAMPGDHFFIHTHTERIWESIRRALRSSSTPVKRRN